MSSQSDSRAARYCQFVSRRAGAILIAALLLFAVAALLASKLELKTAISELLPSDDPGVVALEKTEKRLGDMSLLLVGIRSPDKEANLRYAEVLTRKLQALPKSTVALATYNVRDLRDFFEKNKWLYVGETGSRRDPRSPAQRDREAQESLLVDLSDDDEESVDSMRDRLTKQDRLGGRFPDGVFKNHDGSYVWIAALPPSSIFGEHGGEGIYEAATRLIKENDPRAFNPHMEAFIGGPVATAVATRKAVESDILWVTVTCLVIVALSIALYFSRLRSLPLIATSAVIGTVMAFAVAELAFGYVNSSTAFLGSIIVGNGINYAIILMSRYEECRAAGDSTFDAMQRAIAGVTRGTGVAAVCASAAYATLMLTKFRGFYQFGVMAAFGVLFCWGLTFTVLPALFFLLDRRASTKSQRPARAPFNLSFLGRWIDRRPRSIVIVAVALTIFCSVGLLHFASAPFEYDFRKLNANLQSTEESRQFNQSMEKLFGRWPSPTIVLADDMREVEAIRASIWRNDQAEHVIGQIVTINDVLPGTPEIQTRKLAILGDIRKLTHDPALQALSEKERKQIAQIDISEESSCALSRRRACPGTTPLHRGGRNHRTGGAGLSHRRAPVGLERPRSLAHRPCPAVPAAPGVPQDHRDLGRRRGVRGHDSLHLARRTLGHRGVPDRRLAVFVSHHAPLLRRPVGHRHAPRRRGLDGGHRRNRRGQDHLSQLHCVAHHLRDRRGIRPQHRATVPRRSQHGPRRRLDRRRRRPVFLDYHRGLWLAAGRQQPGLARVRADVHPGRGFLPGRRPDRHARRHPLAPKTPQEPCDGAGPAGLAIVESMRSNLER